MLIRFGPRAPQALRLRGITVHDGTLRTSYIHPLTRFEPPAVITCQLSLDTQVEVGAFTGVYGGTLRHAIVGRYCSIARDVQIGLDGHPMTWLTSSMIGYVPNVHEWAQVTAVPEDVRSSFQGGFASISGLTVIGHDVWIGQGCHILTGITLGDGCVIGSGSVVTKDVAPYTIVAGNPARPIRDRHPTSLTAEILRIQPWRFNLYDVPVEHVRDPKGFVDWYDSEGHELLTPYEPGWVDVDTLRDLDAEG